MIAAIHQPNYLPWLGFFNKMARSDVFVLFDDVQLVRGKSFVTRNRVKIPNNIQWLTVPVKDKGDLIQIKDDRINQDGKWQKSHWRTIQLAYARASYFKKYQSGFSQIYATPWESLQELNIALINLIKDLLGIGTRLVLSSEMSIRSEGSRKIMAILRELNADCYLSGEGKGSKRYIDEEEFRQNNIELIFQGFEHPAYGQLWGDFVPNLSVIDLLFNEGEKSRDIIMQRSLKPSLIG